MTGPIAVTVAQGDGIGPEIMTATLKLLGAAGAALRFEDIKVGKSVYSAANTTGIPPEAWDSLRRTRILLKAPITTPQGGGYQSLNVAIRKTLGLFANVRPCTSYAPFVSTLHPHLDIVVVRENEEDLYAGIEYRQTRQVEACLKLISRPGCEKIVRYAFEYAKSNGRRKVTCIGKDNIMKQTDGLFHRVFDEIGKEYPAIEQNHMIVDIGAARLAVKPEQFDVIVTSNLYGDILSDIVAETSGSVGLAPSANIGDGVAMFEAIHGSAPDIAGKGIANPSGLMLAAVMMLVHMGKGDVAELIHNAWLKTIEEGQHTGDIYREGISRARLSTNAFTEAVIARLGQTPVSLPRVAYGESRPILPNRFPSRAQAEVKKELNGVDIYMDWPGKAVNDLAAKAQLALKSSGIFGLDLKIITNRGARVWPDGSPETFVTDHWRCRFLGRNNQPITHAAIATLLDRMAAVGLDFIKTENLYSFDGVRGWSLGQGE